MFLKNVLGPILVTGYFLSIYAYQPTQLNQSNHIKIEETQLKVLKLQKNIFTNKSNLISDKNGFLEILKDEKCNIINNVEYVFMVDDSESLKEVWAVYIKPFLKKSVELLKGSGRNIPFSIIIFGNSAYLYFSREKFLKFTLAEALSVIDGLSARGMGNTEKIGDAVLIAKEIFKKVSTPATFQRLIVISDGIFLDSDQASIAIDELKALKLNNTFLGHFLYPFEFIKTTSETAINFATVFNDCPKRLATLSRETCPRFHGGNGKKLSVNFDDFIIKTCEEENEDSVPSDPVPAPSDPVPAPPGPAPKTSTPTPASPAPTIIAPAITIKSKSNFLIILGASGAALLLLAAPLIFALINLKKRQQNLKDSEKNPVPDQFGEKVKLKEKEQFQVVTDDLFG